MKEGGVVQIGQLVRDLEDAMRYYWEEFGVGPWDVYELGPPLLRDSVVRGRPSDHRYRIGLAAAGGVQLELIQPQSGRSIYDEHLEKRGEGLHHVKLYYCDCEAAVERFRRKGVSVIQSGRVGKDEFYYLDTEQVLGYVVEIGNSGKLDEPHARYPK